MRLKITAHDLFSYFTISPNHESLIRRHFLQFSCLLNYFSILIVIILFSPLAPNYSFAPLASAFGNREGQIEDQGNTKSIDCLTHLVKAAEEQFSSAEKGRQCNSLCTPLTPLAVHCVTWYPWNSCLSLSPLARSCDFMDKCGGVGGVKQFWLISRSSWALNNFVIMCCFLLYDSWIKG